MVVFIGKTKRFDLVCVSHLRVLSHYRKYDSTVGTPKTGFNRKQNAV